MQSQVARARAGDVKAVAEEEEEGGRDCGDGEEVVRKNLSIWGGLACAALFAVTLERLLNYCSNKQQHGNAWDAAGQGLKISVVIVVASLILVFTLGNTYMLLNLSKRVDCALASSRLTDRHGAEHYPYYW